MAQKKFREDLYFRIKGVSIRIPPLRERRDDIPLLVYYFLKKSSEKYGKEMDTVSHEAHQMLMNYNWPGNVRQLQRTIESAVVLSSGDIITPTDLPEEIRAGNADFGGSTSSLVGLNQKELERAATEQALTAANGNREQAAKMLGIGERTLYRRIKEYGL